MHAPFESKLNVSRLLHSPLSAHQWRSQSYACCPQATTSQSTAHSDALTFALLETVRLVLEERNESEDDRQFDSPGSPISHHAPDFSCDLITALLSQRDRIPRAPITRQTPAHTLQWPAERSEWTLHADNLTHP